MKRILILAGAFLLGFANSASAGYFDDNGYSATYYVDANDGNDAWDGKSPTWAGGESLVGPKKTVQAAVDLIQNDWTCREIVLAPGDYTEGGTTNNANSIQTNRVVVKYSNLTIRSSTRNPADVRIVGRHGADATGMGEGAVRCLALNSGVGKVVVQGITFCNGACGSQATRNGGGLYTSTAPVDKNGKFKGLCLIDCVVSNCVAVSGGGVYNAIIHSSRLTGNDCVKADGTISNNGAAGFNCYLANCLVDHNYGNQPFGAGEFASQFVNCTFADNKGVSDGSFSRVCYGGTSTLANIISFGLPNNGTFKFHYRSVIEGTNVSTHEYDDFTTANSGTGVTKYQLLASALGDYHPVMGGKCDGNGDGSYLTSVPMPQDNDFGWPEHYTYHDLEGNLVPTEGAVTIGAYQRTVSGVPAAARIECGDDAIWFEGAEYPAKKGDWIIPTTWPVTYRIKSTYGLNDTYAIIADTTDYYYLQYDGWTAFTPKPDATATHTLKVQKAMLHVYVDPNGDDDKDGTSPEKAVKSLNKAYGIATNTHSVIHAANGDYSDLGDNASIIYNQSSAYRNVGLRADERGGAAIVGRPDPDTGNVGPKAARLLYLDGNTYSFVQGFVLRDGYVNSSSGSQQMRERAGAVFVSGQSVKPQVLDCVISNCTGRSAAAAHCGTLVRTKIVCNHAVGGCNPESEDQIVCVSGSRLVSCVLADNEKADVAPGSSYRILNDASAYGCSADCGGYCLGSGGNTKGYGCDAVNSATIVLQTGSVANLLNKETCFANPAAHDFRLGVLSPAIGFVKKDDLLSVADYWKFMTTGIDGSVPVYTAEGSRTAGAYPGTPLAMYVTCGSEDGSGTTTNAVTSAGQEVTVTATDADKRPFLGFEVNGVTNLTTETSLTFTPSAEPGAITVVRALYSFDLFVDVNSPAGEDGDGLSWATAFDTLAKAAAKSRPGDTIRVAEGVYDRESMLQTEALIGTNTAGGVSIGCRVLVPSGVTLKAEGAVEKTVIRGASATTDADAYGNGPDAIRCVALEANARVVGFTLTGGRTAKEGTYDIDDTCGGAVIGVRTAGKSAGYDVCEVVGCIVSNDWAYYSGAGEYCRFVRSRVFDCGATEAQSVGRYVRFNSCVFDRCRGNGAIMNFYEFDSCTVGGDIAATGGSTSINFLAHPFKDGRPVVNSIFLCQRVDADANWSNSPFVATNCVFFGTAESSFATNWSTYTVLDRCVWTTKDVSTLLTADHRPVPGVFTEALDRGDETISEREALAGTDLTGFPRVTNGARDIGALEADWRPRYGRDIGGRVTVTDASWNVVEQDGKVTVPGGAAIAFTVVNRGSSVIDGVLNVTVGGGTLSVTMDDAPVAFGDPSAIRLALTPGEHAVVVSLAGEATSSAVIESFKKNVGGLLIIR